MVVRKIFEGNFDEEVHSDFLKFGRGEYKNRYLLEGKRQKNGWSIKTGPEYVNFIVKKCLSKMQGRFFTSGVIISTMDLTSEMNFPIKKKSNFQGIRKFQLETEVIVEDILNLIKKYPKVFFALSFKGEGFELKVKAKAPKSGKPGKESEEGPKADFCSIKTNDKEIVGELFFDFPDFNEISVNHTIKIEEIIYPENMASLRPEEIREQSKRKGKIIRRICIDGKEEIKEAEFVA
jgi:hypothetical protein